MKILLANFVGQSIRRVFDEGAKTWFAVVGVGVVQGLTQPADDRTT